MPDIVTTLGADVSDLKGGLRQAAREYESHKREVSRIDRKFGADAAREFDRIIGKQKAMQDGQNRFARAAGRMAGRIKANWQTITTAMTAGTAAMAGGIALAERSVSRYAERYEFAARRVELASSRMAKGRDKFDRNIFLTYDTADPGSVGSSLYGAVAAVQDYLAGLARGGAYGGFEEIEKTNRGLDRAELVDRTIVNARNDRMLRASDRARLFSDRGLTGAATIENLRIQKFGAAQKLNSANINAGQRMDAIARLESSFERMAQRFGRFDASVDAERGYRSAGLRADDGTVAGGFRARRNSILADAEAAARGITTGDGTPESRAAAMADLYTVTQRRIDALNRERDTQAAIAKIERDRVGLIGKVGFDARRRMAASEAELARARARGTITDPGMLADELARIDATESSTLAGIGRDEAGARGRAGDMLEGLRIDRLRRRGNTQDAERAQIRLRFAQYERELVSSLGEGGGGMLAGLKEEMKKALEDVGLDGSRDGTDESVAPALLGGFAGVRGRIGGRNQAERLLERIAENTEGSVAFVRR